MMTIKDLFENEELMNDMVEDLEDLPEDAEVIYCVWALGYTADEDCSDAEYLLGEFDDPDEAVEFAEAVTLEKVSNAAEEETGSTEFPSEVAYFSIEVETVVGDPEDEDGGTMNIGTIYSRDLWIDGEYGSEDDAPDYDDPVVAMSSDDYTITEEGLLKVSCELLKDFNKNDIIYVDFVEEPDADIMRYQIISKVIYADGDYCHCELLI